MLEHLKRLRQHQDLLAAFTLREIQIRYQQTFLGVGWAIAQPLVLMIVLTGLKVGDRCFT